MQTTNDVVEEAWPCVAGRMAESPSVWRRHGLAVLLLTAVTMSLGAAVYAAALAAALPSAQAGVLTLFAVTLWIGLAAGPAAAGARDAFGALLRGVVLADASIVTLLILGSAGVLGWWDGLRIYLLWLAMVLTAVAMTRLGRGTTGRAAWAALATVLMLAAMGGLFWSGGLIAAARTDCKSTVASAVLRINPLAGVAAVVGPRTGFLWPRQGDLIYSLRITPMVENFPAPPVHWWGPLLVWMLLATSVAAVLLVRRAWRSFYRGA